MGCTLFQPINNLYQSVISCLLWWAYFVLSSSFAWLFSCCFSSSCSCPCCCRFRPGFSLFRGPAILFFGFFVFVSGRIVFGVVGIVGVSAVTCFYQFVFGFVRVVWFFWFQHELWLLWGDYPFRSFRQLACMPGPQILHNRNSALINNRSLDQF